MLDLLGGWIYIHLAGVLAEASCSGLCAGSVITSTNNEAYCTCAGSGTVLYCTSTGCGKEGKDYVVTRPPPPLPDCHHLQECIRMSQIKPRNCPEVKTDEMAGGRIGSYRTDCHQELLGVIHE